MTKSKATGFFFIAVFITFTLASVSHSQFVLFELRSVGAQIPLNTWLTFTFQDWIGLLPGFGPIILIGLLLGFTTLKLLKRWLPLKPTFRYALAGALALMAVHTLMHPIFHITLIAGSRTFWGLLMQCVSGAIGGFFFGWFLSKSNHLPE